MMNYREELMRRREEEKRQQQAAQAQSSAKMAKARRGLLLAGIITTLVALLAITPMRFKAIAGDEVDPVESYLVSNMNDSITDADTVVEAQMASQNGNSLMLFAESIQNDSFENLSTTDKLFRIKYLIADGSLIDENTTINDIYASEESLDAFIAQFENNVPLLDPGEDSLYYVAMIDTAEFNGYGQVVNANFAMNNDNGEMINDIIFDPETGIAYVPKYYYDNSFQQPGIITTDGLLTETEVSLDDDGITEPASQQEDAATEDDQTTVTDMPLTEELPAESPAEGEIEVPETEGTSAVLPDATDTETETAVAPDAVAQTDNEDGVQAEATVVPDATPMSEDVPTSIVSEESIVQGSVTVGEVNAEGEENPAVEAQEQAESLVTDQDLIDLTPLNLPPTAEYFDENADPAIAGAADAYVNTKDMEVADELEAAGIQSVMSIPIQGQLLVSYDFAEDFTADTVTVPVSISSQRADVRTSGITEVSAQMFDTTTTIPIVDIADADKIDATDIIIYAGGSDEPINIIGSNGYYDATTGSIVLAINPTTLSSLKITIMTEDVMEQVIDTLLQPEEANAGISGRDMKAWPEGELTKLDTNAFRNSVNNHWKHDYDGHYAYIAWHTETDRAIYAAAPYMYSRPEISWGYTGSSNDLASEISWGSRGFDSVMNLEGGLVAQDHRGSIQNTRWGGGGTLTGGFSLPGDAGNGGGGEKVSPVVDGMDFSGLGSLTYRGTQKYMMLAGTCAHIYLSVNKGSVEYSWGRIRMRPLYIDENCADPYVVIGFVTYAPSRDSQSYTGVYKFRLNKKVDAQILKKSSNADVVTQYPDTYNDFSNCVFGLYDNQDAAEKATKDHPGTPVATFRTKKDGSSDVAHVNPGTYWVKELEAPKNYRTLEGAHKVEVVANNRNVFTFYDDPSITNWLKLKKVSANTDVTNGNEFYAQNCEGAVFGVYADKASADAAGINNPGSPIAKLTVGKDGTTNEWDVMSWNTDAQKYNRSFFLKEIVLPKGYKANTKTLEAKVTINQHVVITTSDEPETVSVKVHKRDAETGKAPSGGTFEFALYNSNKQELTKYGRKTAVGGADVEWTGLPYGLYYVKETAASYPYMVNDNFLTADVRPTNKNATVTVNADDTQRRGTVSIVKTDANDGNKLENVSFILRSKQDVVSLDGTARHKNNEPVAVVKQSDGVYLFDPNAATSSATTTMKTNKDGSLTVKGLYLTTGDTSFQFEETATIDGHIINKTPVLLTIRKDETKAEITANGALTNEINSIDIYKKALKDDSPIEGVTMALWNSKNDLVVPKASGEANYDSIAIRTPAGSEDYRPIVVKRTGSATVSATGIPEGYLLVGDTDASIAEGQKKVAEEQAKEEAQVQAEAILMAEGAEDDGGLVAQADVRDMEEAQEAGFLQNQEEEGVTALSDNDEQPLSVADPASVTPQPAPLASEEDDQVLLVQTQADNQGKMAATAQPQATADDVATVTSKASDTNAKADDAQDSQGATDATTGKDASDSKKDDANDAPAEEKKDDTNDAPAEEKKDDANDAPAEEKKEDASDTPTEEKKEDASDTPTEEKKQQESPLELEAKKHLFAFGSGSAADATVSIQPGVYHIRLIDANGNVAAEADLEQGIIGDASHAKITVNNKSIAVETEKVGNQGVNATIAWDEKQNAWIANDLVAGADYNVEMGGRTVKVIKTSESGGKTHYGRYSNADVGIFAQGWLDQAALPKSDANIITKVTISNKEYAYGTITDKEGHIHIDRLPFGDYTLVEAKPASALHTTYLVDPNAHHFNVKKDEGYIRDTDTLTDGFHDGTEGTYTKNKAFIFKDDITKLNISKREVTGGPEVEGATLTLTSFEENDIIDQWVSTTEPHYIEGLKPGVYWLIERMTPNNYDQAEAIKFTLLPTGEVQHVEMLDAPIVIDAEIDKRQEIAKPLNEAHMENGDGKNNAAVTDSPFAFYDYSIDFRSNSNTWVDEFTVEDPLDVVTDDMARVVSVATPQAWQDYDGKMNVWYKTNKDDELMARNIKDQDGTDKKDTETEDKDKNKESDSDNKENKDSDNKDDKESKDSDDKSDSQSEDKDKKGDANESKEASASTQGESTDALALPKQTMTDEDAQALSGVTITIADTPIEFDPKKSLETRPSIDFSDRADLLYAVKSLETAEAVMPVFNNLPDGWSVSPEKKLSVSQKVDEDGVASGAITIIMSIINSKNNHTYTYGFDYLYKKLQKEFDLYSQYNATLSDGHVNPWLTDENAMKNDPNKDGRIINYTGWQLWAADVPTMVSTDLLVRDLNLQYDEYITGIRFEYGRVESGFTTRPDEWSRDLLKDEHDDLDDILTADRRSFENADVAAEAAIKATDRIVSSFTSEASQSAEADLKAKSEADLVRYEHLLKEIEEYNANRDAESTLPERFLEARRQPAFEGEDDDATKIIAARDAGKLSIQAAFTLDDTAEGRLTLRKAIANALSDIKGVVDEDTYNTFLEMVLEYDSCYLTNDPERYGNAKTNLVNGLCIIIDKVAETGLAGRVHYSPAILHMQATENYVPDKELHNSAKVDTYRNGGGDKLEAHDKDEVRQRAKERIMEIGTTLTADGGQKELFFDLDKTTQDEVDATEINFIDTVSYSGLRPGVEYVMVGELHTKMGSVDAGPLVSGGKTVRATIVFTPERESGTIEVPLKATVGSFAPNPVVAFEELHMSFSGVMDDQILAEHKDIDDANQTVTVSMGASDEIINPVRRIFKGTPLAQTGDAVIIVGSIVILSASVIAIVLYRRRNKA